MIFVCLVLIFFGAGLGYIMGRQRPKAPAPAPAPDDWQFLGQTIMEWAGTINGNKVVSQKDLVMFYGAGVNYSRRKVVCSKPFQNPRFVAAATEAHDDYVKNVPRWLEGDNLYRGIAGPSGNLINFAKKTHNYDWDSTNKRWTDLSEKKEPPALQLPAKATDDVIDALMREKESGVS